ncbi:TIM44-like domain-containing protein [Thiomicrorhabdus sp. zzn3]|uniref:Tim44 domain-containing protein n=1 Tax=Thiomicrorhabdus sp. zzn3 TaxID=3039775 RepID=UPI0024370A4F|nr:TIM44-like domain-containing protein [Thiomicrorhabdus sp. zzn3]MDG6778966.1 TIM44-like domain-containing protein [Thiomicrorhabdus sp. zzn3]
MKKIWVAWFTVLIAMLSFAQVAEAKRFGSGSSIGYSKKVPAKSYNTAPTAPSKSTSTAAATTKSASGASKWLGPLAGLAAGGLLAAMLFGDGFEGLQIMDLLIFALIAFMLFKLFAARRQSMQTSQAEMRSDYGYVEPNPKKPVAQYREPASVQPVQPANPSQVEGSIIGSALGDAPTQHAVKLNEAPDWFDAEQFVEGAKEHFKSLQKAWDSLDVSEIRDYCTPELFAEIEKQMIGRSAGDSVTVVDTLYTEIADMVVDGEDFIVSLRFSGFIQEAADESAHAFREIWHIRRAAVGEGTWLVAGIQQES